MSKKSERWANRSRERVNNASRKQSTYCWIDEDEGPVRFAMKASLMTGANLGDVHLDDVGVAYQKLMPNEFVSLSTIYGDTQVYSNAAVTPVTTESYSVAVAPYVREMEKLNAEIKQKNNTIAAKDDHIANQRDTIDKLTERVRELERASFSQGW